MDVLLTDKTRKPAKGTRITMQVGGTRDEMRAAMERFEQRVKAEGLKVGKRLGATQLVRDERS
jgi:hypothetical protein